MALKQEAIKANLEFLEGDSDGITNIFFTKPDLNAGQKTTIQALIDKIGTGSITP